MGKEGEEKGYEEKGNDWKRRKGKRKNKRGSKGKMRRSLVNAKGKRKR